MNNSSLGRSGFIAAMVALAAEALGPAETIAAPRAKPRPGPGSGNRHARRKADALARRARRKEARLREIQRARAD